MRRDTLGSMKLKSRKNLVKKRGLMMTTWLTSKMGWKVGREIYQTSKRMSVKMGTWSSPIQKCTLIYINRIPPRLKKMQASTGLRFDSPEGILKQITEICGMNITEVLPFVPLCCKAPTEVVRLTQTKADLKRLQMSLRKLGYGFEYPPFTFSPLIWMD
ncbi:hypothetical protein R1flu_028501 [Riccia fluitans]|uniref:Uncharacterized protein n=1 Tax=Riccia fluitans TaxID=41844 RepID=A0ABD1XQX1_9MARC